MAGLKDGGGPAAGGGLGGNDVCVGGVDEEEVIGGFRPGGGGYDMMNCCVGVLGKMRLRTSRLRRFSCPDRGSDVLLDEWCRLL